MTKYPAISRDTSNLDTSVDIRAGAHSDYGGFLLGIRILLHLTNFLGSLTLLFQRATQPGLEILTPSSSWSPVPPCANDCASPSLLVNIGDLMQFWTNGLLKSTVHRVVFPEGESEDRYSVSILGVTSPQSVLCD